MSSHPSTKRVLIVSLIVDASDILINLVVAILTGSAVMLTEMLQGLVDFVTMVLLVIGNKRSGKPATRQHPFGYGKEVYFWSAMATFIMLAITATASFIIGWRQFQNPHHLENIGLTFIVLTIAILTNGYALRLCIRKLRSEQPGKRLRAMYTSSTSVEIKTTLVLDFVGVAMAGVGFISLLLAHLTGNHSFDGLGAMLMAVILGGMAISLLINVRDLIAGHSADEQTEAAIRTAVLADPEVAAITALRTMILGNSALLVQLNIRLKPNVKDIPAAIDRLEAQLHAKLSIKTYMQVEPE